MAITVDGFGGVYYGQAFNSGMIPFGFTNGKAVDFTDFSSVGLNIKGKVSDDVTTLVQIFATGGLAQNCGCDANGVLVPENFSPFVQLAYANWNIGDGFSARAGRQAIPFLMAGDSLRVGFDQPYRAKPSFVYNMAGLSAYDGVTLTKDWGFSTGKLGVSLLGGSPVNDFPYLASETFQPSNLVGLKVAFIGDGWRVRAQTSQYVTKLSFNGGNSTTVTNGTVQPNNSYVVHGDVLQTRVFR